MTAPIAILLRTGEDLVFSDAPTAGLRMIHAAKEHAAQQIEQIAPLWKQSNAHRGVYDPEEASAMWAAVDAIRADEDAFTASVQAIIDDTELDDSGKLAALAALTAA